MWTRRAMTWLRLMFFARSETLHSPFNHSDSVVGELECVNIQETSPELPRKIGPKARRLPAAPTAAHNGSVVRSCNRLRARLSIQRLAIAGYGYAFSAEK